MRRSPTVILLTLLALSAVMAASVAAVRLVPERTYVDKGIRVTEGRTHRCDFLPPSQWGFGYVTWYGCGLNGSSTETTTRIGFVSICDTHYHSWPPLKPTIPPNDRHQTVRGRVARSNAIAEETCARNSDTSAVVTFPAEVGCGIRRDVVASPVTAHAKPLRHLVTPPHKLLGGRKIRFRVPKGWLVTPISREEDAAYSREWQWEHWAQAGILWRLTKANRSIVFDVAMSYRSNSNTIRPSDAVDIHPTHRGLPGFTFVRELNPYLQERWIILKVPDDINKPLFLICSAVYAKKAESMASSAVDMIVNDVSIR